MELTLETTTSYLKRLASAFGVNVGDYRIAEYFDAMKTADEDAFIAAFERFRNDGDRFPTISQFRKEIAARQGESQSSSIGRGHWDVGKWQAQNHGNGCSCSIGLIYTTRNTEYGKYRFVYRCPLCRSYTAALPFYNGDSLDEERMN